MKIARVVALVCSISIWFYLLHEILEAVGATELMWFLYYGYIPISFAAIIVGEAIGRD